MSLEEKALQNQEYEIPPEGATIGRCYLFADIGTRYNAAFKKDVRQIILGFELPNDLMKDGKPFVDPSAYGSCKKCGAKLSIEKLQNIQREIFYMAATYRRRIINVQQKPFNNIGNIIGLPVSIYIRFTKADIAK